MNSTKEAELIGMHTGDGTLYLTKYSVVWELRGGLDEKEYYLDRVKPLLESIFDVEIHPKFRSGGKNGCFGVQTCNKKIIKFFLTTGFKPGKKTHTVRIPKYILKANKKVKCAFIRGLFDTDGCLRFERINNKKNHTYPKWEFTSASKLLRDDLFELLLELGFRPCIWGRKYYKLCLAGIPQLERFMVEIGPANVKHLNKYELWQLHGYVAPRSHSLAIAVDC